MPMSNLWHGSSVSLGTAILAAMMTSLGATMTTMMWCCHCYQPLYSKEPTIAGLLGCRSYTTGDSGSTCIWWLLTQVVTGKHKYAQKEVFTLPQVFLVNPHGMTWNLCRSMQILSREWNSLLLMFWPLQSTWISADPHGFQVKLHGILGLYSDNSKLTFMCVD
jgi:hypothetical protein